MHSFDNCVNSREREDIFDHDSIYFSIIEYGLITPILLFDIEDGS